MGPVTASSRSSSRPAGRLFVLLVLAVLAGVLGMHGLAPGGLPTPQRTVRVHAMTPKASTAADGVPYADAGCTHTDGLPGHLDHADGACVAAGTVTAYTPPVLTGALLDEPATLSLTSAATGSPHDGRAPPDLSELQLLRI